MIVETFLTATEEWRLLVGIALMIVFGISYFFSGLWLTLALVTPLWYWLGLASAILYVATAKESWLISKSWQKVIMCVTGAFILVTAPFQWIIAAFWAVVWILCDLVRPLQQYRDKTHWWWTIASFIIGLGLISTANFSVPYLSLFQWSDVARRARLPYAEVPLTYCQGCNELDFRMMAQVLRVTRNPEIAQAIVALPPFTSSDFVNSMTTQFGKVLIVWPLNR